MTTRLAIRGFSKTVLQFEERFDLHSTEIDQVVPNLALRHADATAEGLIDMVEIEFLDEPNEDQRYFRIGTNPAGMVLPLAVLMGAEEVQ